VRVPVRGVQAGREERRVRAEPGPLRTEHRERLREHVSERETRAVLHPSVAGRGVDEHVGTRVGDHQQFAEEAGSEVRHDDRQRRMP